MGELRGVLAGAGYFSEFHLDAWARVPGAAIVAICDVDREKAARRAEQWRVPAVYTDVERMLDAERPDFLDVATPYATHAAICDAAGRRGVHVLCQKPLAGSLPEARRIVAGAERHGIRLMVHENFRFQPWHREMRRLIDAGAVGAVHSVSCRMRMGDGWRPDAYLARQPYFREMPQFLVFETGVHFVDVFRFLAGDVVRVYARLRRLNAAIAGEDCGLIVFEFAGGAIGVLDMNRYNEGLAPDPRYTFGEFLVEGEAGAIHLDGEGGLRLHLLGRPPVPHAYVHERRGFAGDCCHAAISHFVERLASGQRFETQARAYIENLAVQDAIYRSAASGLPETVDPGPRE